MFFLGVGMGRLRFHHKLDTSARFCVAVDGPFLEQAFHELHDFLHFRAFAVDANTVRRFSADTNQ